MLDAVFKINFAAINTDKRCLILFKPELQQVRYESAQHQDEFK